MGHHAQAVAALPGRSEHRLVGPHYGPTNAERSTGPVCDGCQSVNYKIPTKAVTEWSVDCERCHGPGSEHLRRPAATSFTHFPDRPAHKNRMQGNDFVQSVRYRRQEHEMATRHVEELDQRVSLARGILSNHNSYQWLPDWIGSAVAMHLSSQE